jgi:hypothetical protein
MRHLLRVRGSLIAKLAFLCLLALSLLPLGGCSQGGVVEGEVHYKYVTGMQDRRYFIIVLKGPSDGQPPLVFDTSANDAIRNSFKESDTNLVVDNATEEQIAASYDRIYYQVTIHITSGSHYYEQAYRTEREIFNEIQLGTAVKVDTEASDIGPKILRIVE